MDRSDWYYRQIVTQAELDTAFDDPEAALRALSSDLSLLYGVATGMLIQEDSGGASGDIEVTTGAGYDSQGRRVPVLSLQTLDLSSLMPDANPRYVRIYAEFARTLSDPRLDGNNDPVDYRQTEEAVLSFVAGTPAGSPTKPAIDTSKLLLATILIPGSATTISDSDISMATDIENALADPDRVETGVLLRRGVLTAESVYFDETGSYSINGPSAIVMKSQGDISNVDSLTLDASGSSDPAIELNDRNIAGVDKLTMQSGGASDPAIEMNNRNIDGVDRITFDAGGFGACIDATGRAAALDGGILLGTSNIQSNGSSNINTGTGASGGGGFYSHGGVIETGEGGSGGGKVDTHGGNVETQGGDILTGSGGSGGGDIISHGGIIHSGQGGSGGGTIRSHGGSIDTDGGDFYSNGGAFRYGPANVETNRLYIPASSALASPTFWDFFPAKTGALYDRWECISVANANERNLIFPIHIPLESKIVSIAVKLNEASSQATTVTLKSSDPNFSTPGSGPVGQTIVAGATASQASAGTGWKVIQDVLSAVHTIVEIANYYIIVEPTVTSTVIHSAEVIYQTDVIRPGVH